LCWVPVVSGLVKVRIFYVLFLFCPIFSDSSFISFVVCEPSIWLWPSPPCHYRSRGRYDDGRGGPPPPRRSGGFNRGGVRLRRSCHFAAPQSPHHHRAPSTTSPHQYTLWASRRCDSLTPAAQPLSMELYKYTPHVPSRRVCSCCNAPQRKRQYCLRNAALKHGVSGETRNPNPSHSISTEDHCIQPQQLLSDL
jgi:hypothetical protein